MDNKLKKGSLVMLINHTYDTYLPPIGACGEVIDFDPPMPGYDITDAIVNFPSHPCPVDDPWWFVHPGSLLVISPDSDADQVPESLPLECANG